MPAIVESVYPELSGVNMRIYLLVDSVKYRFPDKSIVIPPREPKDDVKAGPSTDV